MRSSGVGPAGSLLCDQLVSGAAASQEASRTTRGRITRVGIRYTLTLSVERIWQAAQGLTDPLHIARSPRRRPWGEVRWPTAGPTAPAPAVYPAAKSAIQDLHWRSGVAFA